MADRHSLFWKLAILLVGFCLLMIGLSYTWVLSGYRGDLPYLLRLTAGRLVAHAFPLGLVVAACGAAALAGPRAPP